MQVGDLPSLIQQTSIFDSWSDNGDGTINATTNVYFGTLQAVAQWAVQCGCTDGPPLYGTNSVFGGVVYGPYLQQEIKRAEKAY